MYSRYHQINRSVEVISRVSTLKYPTFYLDPTSAKRSVVIRHCRHALINLKRVKDSSNGVLMNGVSGACYC